MDISFPFPTENSIRKKSNFFPTFTTEVVFAFKQFVQTICQGYMLLSADKKDTAHPAGKIMN